MLIPDLDHLIFRPGASGPTHESRAFSYRTGHGDEIRVRMYGEGVPDGRFILFFPGQSGGIARYEADLIPLLRQAQVPILAISYPGYDGAPGQSHLDRLETELDFCLAQLSRDFLLTHSLFIGRSMGATLALRAASRWHPQGVLIEAVSPSLPQAIRAELERNWLTRPLQILPIERMVPPFDLAPALAAVKDHPVVVVQGTKDDRTPFSNIQALVRKHPWVRFDAVEGGTHRDSYWRDKERFIARVKELLAPTK